MSKQVRISSLLRLAAAVIIAVFPHAAYAALSQGSSFQSFFWTADAEGGVKNGCYGYVKVASANSTTSGVNYASNLWLPKYSWWHSLFMKTYLTTIIKVSNQQPSIISRAPKHFAENQWLEGFERTDSSGHAMRFLFPMPPTSINYGRYDYFTVNVNDTLDLEFYGAGDSIMVGTFVDKRPAANGAVNIIARNAIIVELTKSNPLRINSIRCNGTYEPLVSGYLGYNLKKLKSTAAWYGIDFIDTSSASKIVVDSVAVKNTLPLIAGSSCAAAWKLEGADIVDSCLFSISYDSAATWSASVKSTTTLSHIFVVPKLETVNAFILITACGKNGERISAKSSNFSTIIPADFVLSVTPFTETSVIASWNPAAILAPRSNMLYISYRLDSIVHSMDATTYDSIRYDLTVDRDTITGLLNGGTCYFSAFVPDSNGTLIPAGPRAVDSVAIVGLRVGVDSLMIKGDMPLIIGTPHTITWNIEDPDAIDSCLVSVSFDSAKTWNLAGKPEVDSFVVWTIPNQEAANAFIKITAFGKNGVQASSLSSRFSIIPVPLKVGVHSVVVKGEPPLVAGSTSKVTWSIDDATTIDSCLVSVSFDSAKTWSLAGKTVVDSSFIWTVPNRESANAFIRITACGKNGVHVSSASSRFSTTIPAEYKLRITSLSTSSVIASWNPSALATPKKRSLYIAWRSGSIVRSLSEKKYDSIGYNLTIDRDTIAGLSTTGVYYFSTFVLDSTGAFIFAGPGGIDSAFAEDHTPPINNLVVSGAGLDSTRVMVSWQYSGKRDPDIDSIALWYGNIRFPLSIHDSISQRVTLQSSADSTVTITGLKPATTWYFAMFVADSSGNWSAATEKSMVQLRTAAGQTAIESSAKAVRISIADTQSVFNDSLRIWSTSLKIPYTDTIDSWTAPSLAGFVGATPSFSFRYGMLPAGATITMAIKPGKLPGKYSTTDLQVYRYNIFTGGWRLEEGAVSFSPDSTVIFVTTADARLPFIMMIDTVPPEIGARYSDTAVYRVSEPVIDTLFVADNIENYSIRLLAGPGNLGYSDITLYAAPGSERGMYITTIPAYVADMQSGLRGIFIISDGRNSDSVNLSRKILRENSVIDDVIARPMAWTPLFATAQPFDSLLSGLRAKADGGTWNYDKDNERIYQLFPTTSSNPSDTNIWTEYTDKNSSDFTFAPGKLFWIKSRFATPVEYGDGIVPSLADTLEIPLRHNDWTDFSLPYRFNIYIGDLLAATTAKYENMRDSIELYHWEKTDTTYSTEALYLPGISARSGDSIIVPSAQPFTVYNASHRDITLKIPPVSTPMSIYGKHAGSLKKAPADDPWSIKIAMFDRSGNRLPSMYIGRTPQSGKYRYYPMPPAFNDVSAGIVDETTGRRYGSAARGDLTQGGATYRIAFENGSATPRDIISTIASTCQLPPGIRAYLFRNDDYRAAASGDTSEISLSPHDKITAYLALGTDDYIKKVVRNLTSKLSFQPYTCNGALAVRYTLPTDVRHLTISIFDLKGRRVDLMRKTSGLDAGPGLLMWRSLRPPGYYIIQMNVAVNGNNTPLIMNKRWLYVR